MRGWLQGTGLRVVSVESSRRYVEVTGTAAAAEAAFGVKLNRYHHDGGVFQAPDRAAHVPSNVAANVLAVSGLDTAPHLSRPDNVVDGSRRGRPNVLPPAGFRNARPCSLFYGQLRADTQGDFKTPLPKFDGRFRDYAPCGYTPVQFRTVYGVADSGLTGKGVTVAITDAYASRTIRADANQYASNVGDAPFSKGQFRQSVTRPFRMQVACDASGWASEEALDVEAVHGIAPDAKLRYYGARSCDDFDLIDATARVVDENRASIVTDSWGSPEEANTTAVVAASEQVFRQAALQGIGFLFSSGDDGDELLATGIKQADYPAGDPLVTAVGGTDTAIGPSGELLWQTGWGTLRWLLADDGKSWVPDTFLYGSGGGFSHLFDRPSYQAGVVPAASPAGRAVPDISLDGSVTTGMLIGLTQVFPEGTHYDQFRIGGTSLSSPLVAGLQALKTQASGGRLGFANPAIYAAAGTASFTDVRPVHTGDANVRPDYVNGLDPSEGVTYSIRTFGQDTSLMTTRGWDDVTGIGTPTPRWFTSGT